MKKIIFILALFIGVIGLDCNAKSWKEWTDYYVAETQQNISEMQSEFQSAGIDASLTCGYDQKTNACWIDCRFDAQFWQVFTAMALDAAKDATIMEYRQNYSNDASFKDFIDAMKENGGKIKVIYSCEENGKVKAKDFYVSPEEIIN